MLEATRVVSIPIGRSPVKKGIAGTGDTKLEDEDEELEDASDTDALEKGKPKMALFPSPGDSPCLSKIIS